MNNRFKCLIIGSTILTMVGCAKTPSMESSNKVEATVAPVPIVEVKEKKKEEVIPEPYTLAKREIEKGDLNATLQYLDLTIKDFPDSPYTYNAHYIKSLLLASKLFSALQTTSQIGKGTEHKSVLWNQDDFNVLKSYMKIFEIEKSNSYNKFKESISFMLDKYNKDNATTTFGELKYTPTAQGNDLSFFANVGYPVPVKSDVEQFQEVVFQKTFSDFIGVTIKEGKISYPDFFIYTVGFFDDKEDKELMLKLNNKVIELTENDKYNKARLTAESNIKALNESK